jgi:hypothetical protein
MRSRATYMKQKEEAFSRKIIFIQRFFEDDGMRDDSLSTSS